MGGKMGGVPQGTAERFFRPLRDFVHRGHGVPSAEALGYFHGCRVSVGALSNNRISTVSAEARKSPKMAAWGRRHEKRADRGMVNFAQRAPVSVFSVQFTDVQPDNQVFCPERKVF